LDCQSWRAYLAAGEMESQLSPFASAAPPVDHGEVPNSFHGLEKAPAAALGTQQKKKKKNNSATPRKIIRIEGQPEFTFDT